jgi:acetyl esterase/lipase
MIRRFCLAVAAAACACCIFLTATTHAAELKDKEFLKLWEKPPLAKGDTDKDVPAMQVFMPEKGKATGAAFVVCPGGGYGHLAPHEGQPVAEWLARQGITAFVLRYRIAPDYGYPAPLLDAQRAIRTVRASAKEWGLDEKRIGILGFSAGGHLASSAATHHTAGQKDAADPIDRVSSRPDLQILIYPVITMGEWTHGGSKRNLLGQGAPDELVELMSNEKQVTTDTPPAFIVHPIKDSAVPVRNSDEYVMNLAIQNVPFLYIREQLPDHGFGMKDFWTVPAEGWLKLKGFTNTMEKK